MSKTAPAIDQDLDAKLKELGVEQDIITKLTGELGVTTVADLSALTEADLTAAGMKVIPARNFVKALIPTQAEPSKEVSFDGILPDVPSDESWLKALQTGGVLKVGEPTVIAAIRTALAQRVGLYELPERVVQKMEAFANEAEEPVDEEFFKIRNLLTRRSYAEVFQAIEGLDGSYVTKERKKELLGRIDDHLWPAIIDFQDLLDGWQKAWMSGGNQMAMMAMVMQGAVGGAMPPGIMSPPDTGAIRDQAGAVADAANRVFKGTGMQIASALAYEASQISKIMQNPRLPALTGTPNRDALLRSLGGGIPATYPRLETNLVQYVLTVFRLKDIAGGQDEIRMLSALFMLGTQITWSTLGGSDPSGVTGIGGGSRL